MSLSLGLTSTDLKRHSFVNEADVTLPTNDTSFQPETGRDWIIRFWELPGKWVGIAFPFGFVLWILFYFDHNVSVSRLLTFIMNAADEPVVDSPGIRVSTQKTTWIPLGFLPPWLRIVPLWSAGSTSIERYVPRTSTSQSVARFD